MLKTVLRTFSFPIGIQEEEATKAVRRRVNRSGVINLRIVPEPFSIYWIPETDLFAIDYYIYYEED